MTDVDKIATGLFEAVAGYVSKRIKPLQDRIAELESKPVPDCQGTWKGDKTYKAGTLITHGGSMWFATGETRQRPGSGPGSQWVLCVKSGAFSSRDRDRGSGPR